MRKVKPSCRPPAPFFSNKHYLLYIRYYFTCRPGQQDSVPRRLCRGPVESPFAGRRIRGRPFLILQEFFSFSKSISLIPTLGRC